MLADDGQRDVQGTPYHQYSAAGLEANSELRLTLTGSPSSGTPTLPLGSSSNLIVGLGGLGVALIAAGLLLYRRSQQDADLEADEAPQVPEEELGPDTPDSIMDAILALDDLYQAGELPDEAYLERRTELKTRLQAVMGK
jgi:hypothetical protein